jgi:PAS domain S-box-containing protein
MFDSHRPQPGPGGEPPGREADQNLLIQQAINSILRISLEPISLDEQMHRVLALLLQLPWLALEARGCIYLVEDGAKQLVMKAHLGMPAGVLGTCSLVPFGTCLCGQAIADNEIVFFGGVDACHTILYPGIQPHGHYCVPLGCGGRRVGLLNLYVREGHQPSPVEERFLRAAADVLAGIIERQRTRERLQEQLRLAAFGRDVGLALSHGDRLPDMLRRCAEAVVGHLGGALARIWTLNEAEGVLELQASAGLYTHTDGAHRRVPVGRYKIGLIAQERQPHLTNEVLADPRVHDQAWARREGLVAFAGYPLLVEDRLVGVMAMFARQPLSEATLQAMASVANGIALGVERKRAERAVRESEARKAAILETALDGIITIDHTGRVIEFNPAAEATFGFRRAEVLGQPMAELLVPPSLQAQHYRGLARCLATGQGPVLNRRVEMPARRADGTEFPVEMAVTRIATEGPPLFTAYLRDLTDRKRLERRRSARLALTQILGEAATLQEAAPRILQAVCEGLAWDAGAFWAVDPHAGVLRCLDSWHLATVPEGAWGAFCRRQTFPPGVGLPGRIWSSGRPAWVADVTKDAEAPGGPAAAPEGLHGAFACPVWLGRELLGVLGFFSHEVREPDNDLLAMMATIGVQVGQFMQRKEAEGQLRRQEEDRRMAQEVQRGLLPKALPRLPGLDMGGRSAAAQEVGGDCFDFLPLRGAGEECLGVLVADASGHGIGAALLVAQTRAYLRALALACTDVGTLLTLSNQRLAGDLVADHFVTVFLLRLDPRTRCLRYASAGHCPGYVLDRQGRTQAVLASTGIPLGIDPARVFAESPAVPLEPGGLVFLFTDGIEEAAPSDGEQFGPGRTLGIVRAHQQEAPEAILDALFDAVGDFSGQQLRDDITAVIIKAEGGA